MTSNLQLFNSKIVVINALVIHTTNNSHMHATYVGSISKLTLRLLDTFFVPKLTLNLIYVEQLCDLGLTVHFFKHDC